MTVSPPKSPVEWAREIVADVENHPKPLVTVENEPFCRCDQFALQERTRNVRCIRCGRTHEAYDVLIRVFADWGRYARNRVELRHEMDQLRKDREALKREVDNLKAMQKRWATKGEAR